MIDVTMIFGGAAVIYLAALGVLLAMIRRVPKAQRSLCYPVVLVVGVATVGTVFITFDVGDVVVNGTEILVPKVIDDMIAYSLLWVVTARLAEVNGRLLVFVALTPALQRLAFVVANFGGGIVALIGVVVVVGGLLAFAYIFTGTVWEDSRCLPEQRRLLHWKARNLLLFLIGMLIVYGLLLLLGIFDFFVQQMLDQYISILIRVGFAGFLFANLDAVENATLIPSTNPGSDTNRSGERFDETE